MQRRYNQRKFIYIKNNKQRIDHQAFWMLHVVGRQLLLCMLNRVVCARLGVTDIHNNTNYMPERYMFIHEFSSYM